MADNSKHKTARTGWQSERLNPANIPWHKKRMIAEHTARYEFAIPYVVNKHVIDLACGTGYGCGILSSKASSVIGIDNSEEAVAYANNNYQRKNISYKMSDVVKTSLPAKSADVITSFETIEHLADDAAFIKEVYRLLKTNGIFIMSTPNIEFSTGKNPYHVREYYLQECKKLLKDFNSVEVYGQRKVHRPIFKIMKRFPAITAFRPWENVDIRKIKSDKDSDFCYFIFVCR